MADWLSARSQLPSKIVLHITYHRHRTYALCIIPHVPASHCVSDAKMHDYVMHYEKVVSCFVSILSIWFLVFDYREGITVHTT